MTSQPRITLDTNVCGLIANPSDSRYEPNLQNACKYLQTAITEGKVKAFVSEASVFVECLEFSDKLTYLTVVGTPDPRPVPDPRGFATFDALVKLGVKMLHAPLISGERFIENMSWADDELFPIAERQQRFSDFASNYQRLLPLKQLGEEKLKEQPPVPPNRTWPITNGSKSEIRQKWAVALKREWEVALKQEVETGDKTMKNGFKKKVGGLISEWCDTIILASHLAYGNGFFCTCDTGSNAGKDSILHGSKRDTLAQKGIRIVSPWEMISLLAD